MTSSSFPLLNRYPAGKRVSAFSLTELLAAIAIIALLATASGPVLTSLTRQNRVTESAMTLHGLIEGARQEAITRNTIVWLAVSDSPAAGEPARVVLIASRTGDDLLGWENNPDAALDIASFAELELIGPVEKLEGVKIAGAGEVEFPGLQVDVSPFEPVSWSLPAGGETVMFTKAIRFMPTGEARVKTHSRLMEIGILPSTGGKENAVVMRTAALTGKTSMLRPE